MNFGNFVYEYDYNIPEELLMIPENASPPPITRQKAFNNLYNINNNYEFIEVNVESPVYRTLEFNLEVPITSAKSEEYSNSINKNNELPKVKRIKTI